MNSRKSSLCVSVLVVILSSLMSGQQQIASSTVVVPRLMNYSGKAVDAKGTVVYTGAGPTQDIETAVRKAL